ncbi:amidase [Pseudohoeflea coraliihabitans]|uniref:Amidase n=1 Tax=Pseudohoeflea coraliihabitans TaxID=2860393 RepID=A0ABS6WR90_9HYPH|nr:amidase [Pseudohoeflea sp. DP4N28-3]MBW3098163.1 amidase [Pseudohoeflea sp. DP4N28-3]
MKPIADLVRALDEGEVTALTLVEDCLDRIADPEGEGARTFIALDPEDVRTQAKAVDAARGAGRAPSPLAGIPVSIKALFDVQGMVTTAGSAVLRDKPPASEDAVAVARLRAAGLVVIGHTNMTEFAYSGLGLNPHYGTPKNPHGPGGGSAGDARIPGGSSSGAAISVTDAMAAAGLGTDTGGSCRIPAAFCGLVGYKPTARRVPLDGAFPLSKSFDSIGPLARTVDCCARLDAVLAEDTAPLAPPQDLSGMRFAVLRNYVHDGIQSVVAEAFDHALRRLEQAGATLVDLTLPRLDELPALNARGGIIAAEAYAVHRDLIAARGEGYDPRVRVRIERALEQEDGEYEALLAARREMIAAADRATSGFDAVLLPTTPMQAPFFAELEDEAEYGRLNLLALRNPTVANLLDRCAISLPMPTGNNVPAGLMLMGNTMGDRHLLAVSGAVEAVLAASA